MLPSGRSLGHSLLTLVAILIILRVACRYPDQRTLSAAFGIGYASHLVADGIGSVITGDFGELAYLMWPVTDVPTGESQSFIEFFLALEPTPMMLAGIALTIVSGAVWVYDGMPGIKDLLVDYHRAADEIEHRSSK